MRLSLTRLFKGLYRRCLCGCGILIPCINKQGKFSRYKNGHNPIHYSKRVLPTREKHHNYKGGIKKARKYLKILRKHHKYADRWGYVPLHRYRMELMIGRYLTPEERVHHIDGNPSNNEEDNLMLFSNHSEHVTYERTKDMSSRRCKDCNSSKTFMKRRGNKKYPQWSGNNKDGFRCYNCDRREKYKNKKRVELVRRY